MSFGDGFLQLKSKMSWCLGFLPNHVSRIGWSSNSRTPLFNTNQNPLRERQSKMGYVPETPVRKYVEVFVMMEPSGKVVLG